MNKLLDAARCRARSRNDRRSHSGRIFRSACDAGEELFSGAGRVASPRRPLSRPALMKLACYQAQHSSWLTGITLLLAGAFQFRMPSSLSSPLGISEPALSAGDESSMGSRLPSRALLSGLLLDADAGHVFSGSRAPRWNARTNRGYGDREDVALGPNPCSGFWSRTFTLGRLYPGLGRHSDSNSHQFPLFRLVSLDTRVFFLDIQERFDRDSRRLTMESGFSRGHWLFNQTSQTPCFRQRLRTWRHRTKYEDRALL
jgi:hypothetical protein